MRELGLEPRSQRVYIANIPEILDFCYWQRRILTTILLPQQILQNSPDLLRLWLERKDMAPPGLSHDFNKPFVLNPGPLLVLRHVYSTVI